MSGGIDRGRTDQHGTCNTRVVEVFALKDNIYALLEVIDVSKPLVVRRYITNDVDALVKAAELQDKESSYALPDILLIDTIVSPS